MIEVLTVNKYDRALISREIEAQFDHCDFFTRIPANCSILLKPNFVMPSPKDDPSCTHPEFYMAIAEIFLKHGHRVGIGDSPAFGSCKKALKAHLVHDEVLDKGIEIVEFTNNQQYEDSTGQSSYKNLSICKELSEWDILINLPKLKVHQQMHFTGACKNLYGCVAGKKKILLHNLCKNKPVKFAEMILVNAKKAQAILHIADGIHAMHVTGPRGGDVHEFGKVLIGDNPLQVDYIFAKMANFKVEETPLFAALANEVFQEISTACEDTVNHPNFTYAENFVHSYINDISFSPPKLIRSGIRSLKFKLTGKV
ncbi:DUF362 domain-containing protein [Lentisphaera profundi]|uniref:DUF362 domain-containing protein n=1 Tax=Lentisphaera profundi TaxID=1658616 RepID=A0ABY7VRR7_9BACT|nr:DUF362 domain-containing protein [Lentisphaera profundi]WDE96737.1 DUF362 domain-containing protein [Lentisphaera profundi]